MTKALTTANSALAALDDSTRDFAQQVKSVLNFEGTDKDLALFATVARRLGLDPFARQVYAVFRGGKMTIQTGIDGYRVIAFRAGLDAIDEPEFGPLKNGHPEWAKIRVWRKGSERPTVGVAYWDEYAQGGQMWQRMGRTMLAKCAESQALRKAFPEALSGVYTDDEMTQADREPRVIAHREAAVDAVIETVESPEEAERQERIAAVRTEVKARKEGDDPEITDAVRAWLEELGAAKLSDLTNDQLFDIAGRLGARAVARREAALFDAEAAA